MITLLLLGDNFIANWHFRFFMFKGEKFWEANSFLFFAKDLVVNYFQRLI